MSKLARVSVSERSASRIYKKHWEVSMKKYLYDDMHKLFPLSKTLRFELRPYGKTLEHIHNDNLINQDHHRAEAYERLKQIIDQYHKYFIDKSLDGLKLENLVDYYAIASKAILTYEEKKEISQIQEKLRKEIAKRFVNQDEFKGIFGKEIITEYLAEYLRKHQDERIDAKLLDIEEFKKFTTYFRGFNENRKNMYSDEEKSTAIANRLIDENLPLFINNMKIFNKVNLALSKDDFNKIYSDLEKFLRVFNIEEMFNLEYFNETLSQAGIEVYNLVIGGYSKNNGDKVKGINEYINLYNQKVDKNNRIPKLRQLYKQILSDRLTGSFVLDNFNYDKELKDAIQQYHEILIKYVFEFSENGSKNIRELISNLTDYKVDSIFINNDKTLTDLSQEIFGDWSLAPDCIGKDYDANYGGKRPFGSEKYIEEKKKELKKQQVYSLGFLNQCLNKYSEQPQDKFINHLENHYLMVDNTNVLTEVQVNFERIQNLLIAESDDSRALIKDEAGISLIKSYLDSVLLLEQKVRIFIPKDKTIEKDEFFYNNLMDIYGHLSIIRNLYNKVRNYLTQKPFSTDKVKINFNCSTLLAGWDLNKEKDNLGVILEKDGLLYLGIINRKNKRIFIDATESSEENCFRKMEYKLLPDPHKMLPKVFFSKSRMKEFGASQDLLGKYNIGQHKKGDGFDIRFCHELIDYYKAAIDKHEDWSKFGFKFSDTQSYSDMSGFFKEIEQQSYKITFKNYSADYIEELVENNKLYLFQIYNKDFSPNSHGKKNLHTLYFQALFDESNLNDLVYKLSGEAEIFYRPASLKISDTTVHEHNQEIQNKNANNPKKTSTFTYDIIKDKRYTQDKFQLHLPIKMNFLNKGINSVKKTNSLINQKIRGADGIYILGIDRGERNLLYLCLIDERGRIVKQISLNKIVNDVNGSAYVNDYSRMLEEKADARDKARKSWKTIENIKELKSGYLSQVIYRITKLIDEYQPIIVMENLNYGFKNSRIKVEKQVYQKFENMLIDKLNYLIFKDKHINEPGGLQNAYQLAAIPETQRQIKNKPLIRQTGIVFYVPAWNTSKIDPITGFVNLFNTRYENITKTKEFISKFDYIHYDAGNDWFTFDFDYSKFQTKINGQQSSWSISTNSTRIETFRNPEKNSQWDQREVNLTEEFCRLFEKYGIRHDHIQEDSSKVELKEYFEKFMYLFRLTLQMRNSVTGSDVDYMISPVRNKNGFFYDSRDGNQEWPVDADANGAFNIARKGLMLVRQIYDYSEDDLDKIKFSLSNAEWLEYVQNQGN